MKFERRVVLFTGVGIVCLVVFLAIRNKPFTDPALAESVRIVLALAVAVLGGGIVGEGLRLKFNAFGFGIRAAGAAALFVICYFGTPNIRALNLKEAEVSFIKIKQIDFRTQALPGNDDATRRDAPLYVTVPLGVKNTAQPALNAFVNSSQIQFSLKGKEYVYDWRNFVVMHEEKHGLWLGIEGDAVPFAVDAGAVVYKEILHSNDKAMSWGEFLDAIKASSSESLNVTVHVDVSGVERVERCVVPLSEWAKKVDEFISREGRLPGRVTMACV